MADTLIYPNGIDAETSELLPMIWKGVTRIRSTLERSKQLSQEK